jgi:hypothetical protein
MSGRGVRPASPTLAWPSSGCFPKAEGSSISRRAFGFFETIPAATTKGYRVSVLLGGKLYPGLLIPLAVLGTAVGAIAPAVAGVPAVAAGAPKLYPVGRLVLPGR